MMRFSSLNMIAFAALMVAAVGCKPKDKNKDSAADLAAAAKLHQTVKPMSATALEAARKSFSDANGAGWTVTVDAFTGNIATAYRKMPKGRAKAFPQKGAIKEARAFLEKNAKAFGFEASMLAADRLDVLGRPGGKGSPGRWLILVRGTSHFAHAGFDAYDLGDRLEVSLVVIADGVLKAESRSPLPAVTLPDRPHIMWNDAKISKHVGTRKPNGTPQQMIHVLKSDDAIEYKVAWRFAFGDAASEKTEWYDAATGEKLPAPYFETVAVPMKKVSPKKG